MEPIAFAVTELKIMNVVWAAGGTSSAKDVYDSLAHNYGYTRGAVYALIHRLIDKGALTRRDPGFVLTATIAMKDVQHAEAQNLVDRLFSGSAPQLVASLIEDGQLSPNACADLLRLANETTEESTPPPAL